MPDPYPNTAIRETDKKRFDFRSITQCRKKLSLRWREKITKGQTFKDKYGRSYYVPKAPKPLVVKYIWGDDRYEMPLHCILPAKLRNEIRKVWHKSTALDECNKFTFEGSECEIFEFKELDLGESEEEKEDEEGVNDETSNIDVKETNQEDSGEEEDNDAASNNGVHASNTKGKKWMDKFVSNTFDSSDSPDSSDTLSL
ncbi:hypothetical protein ACHAXS_003861 [Conticribra weissflogii]